MELRGRAIAAIVAVSLICGACSTASADEADVGIALPVGSTADEGAAETSTTTAAPTTTVAPPVTTTEAPDRHRTWIATAKDHVEHLEAFVAPDGIPVPLPYEVSNPYAFESPLTLMVTDGSPGDEWLKAQLPVRPNGREAWIRSSDYELTSTRIHAEVVLSETYVAVYEGDELIAESEAVIGSSDTPTPLGTFYVSALRESLEGEEFLGPVALVLSGYSEVLESFSGGLPVIAIHGTNRPDQMGSAISFGCVRVPNEVIEFLAEHVPLGAPVQILA